MILANQKSSGECGVEMLDFLAYRNGFRPFLVVY